MGEIWRIAQKPGKSLGIITPLPERNRQWAAEPLGVAPKTCAFFRKKQRPVPALCPDGLPIDLPSVFW